MERKPEVVALLDRLARPFPDEKVKWKPQTVQGNRALALAYIDARVVQERLDEVLGPENWQSKFVVLDNGSVACELSCRIDGEWITKSDVGGESEQPDKGDRTKAAYSDSLKRAAVQFGVGRHLYSLPKQWCEYDPAKRAFKVQPKLPAVKGGGYPPAQTAPASPGATKPPQTAQKPNGNLKQLPAQAEAKADTSQRVDQAQVDRIDFLVNGMHKSAKWLESGLESKFGKSQLADLTVAEAEQVIAGLEKACGKLGVQVDVKADAPNTVESNAGSTVKSAGKTPARRGAF